MAGNFPPLTPRVGLRQNPAHDPYPFRDDDTNAYIEAAYIETLESTTSTSYTDLATVGPEVTLVTGESALVAYSADLYNSTVGQYAIVSFAVTGVTTINPSNNYALMYQAPVANYHLQASFVIRANLTPGTNTFTVKYVVTGGTGSFRRRRLTVWSV
jgi:hypothetical protein